MRHIGLETNCLRQPDHFQQFHVPPPALHAAPADLAFRRQPLAVACRDMPRLAERIGNNLRVARRVCGPGIDAGRGVNPDHTVLAHAQILQLLRNLTALANLRQELTHLIRISHRRAATRATPNRGDQGARHQIPAAQFIGQNLQVVVGRIDIGVRQAQEEVNAFKFDTVHFSRNRQVQHRVQFDRRFRVRTLANQAGPHRVM